MKPFLLFVTLFITGITIAQPKQHTIITDAAPDLIPEGITVYKGTIYISSIEKHQIIAVNEQGKTRSFIEPGQDGFLEGLGMKVDVGRNVLWALSNKRDSNVYTSQIHGFDLVTGQTKYVHKIQDTIAHLFNDLVLDKYGMLYLTDTYFGALYTFSPNANKFELFLKSPFLQYPNGLAFGKNNRLYIATYTYGLMQLETTTKTLQPFQGSKDTALAHSLDGLVFWNNSLIGIYNGSDDPKKQAVVQYQLDNPGKKIISETILDKGNPAFHEPTTAALSGDLLYVLANSHLAAYNQNKTATKGIEQKLMSPRIVVYHIKP